MSRIFFIFSIIIFVSSCSTNDEQILLSTTNNKNLEKSLSEYSDEEVCNKAQFKTDTGLIVWDTYDNLEYVIEARDNRGILCNVTPPSLPKTLTINNDNISKNKPLGSSKRAALLIGNSKYRYMPRLKNPANDVNILESTLKEYGFDVKKETNLNFEQLRDALKSFENDLYSNVELEVIFFYFAGHGLQSGNNNFIAPIDAIINSEDDIKYEMQNADELFSNISDASNKAIKIFILDACRENIFDNSNFKKPNIRLSMNNIWSNTIIGFSTIKGQKSRDGDGKNSPYLEELINAINHSKDKQIEKVLKETRIKVIKRTNEEQTPQEISNLIGNFSF